jgi:dienelactone hydrolase/DNA-directed RNA polymerase subunit RPC12/RpoP
MSITYQCERCGRWYTVRESKVGTLARCKDCDHEMVVPNTPDLLDDAIDGPAGGAAVASRQQSSVPGPAVATSTSRPAAAPADDGKAWRGGLGILGLVLVIALRIAAQGGNRGQPPRANKQQPVVRQMPQQRVGNLDAPVEMPATFPELGAARKIEDGVLFYEVKFRPAAVPPRPGHSGTIWLYLPETEKGRPAPKSLPCVLIAPAGSDCLTGMSLDKGDPARGNPGDPPEHLPYVKAGFAVLAFDLDGPDPDPAPSLDQRKLHIPPVSEMGKFLRARAGLVNGKIAKEFLNRRVPEVDPDRLYVAGHSSAASFALLFAEHDRDIKGCVAYAPAVDLREHLGRRGPGVRNRGFEDLITRCSPHAEESRLNCPVFLFQSRKDRFVLPAESEGLAERLASQNKPVTLKLVDGDEKDPHYEPMIKQGIPAGIAWLKARDAEVRAGKK